MNIHDLLEEALEDLRTAHGMVRDLAEVEIPGSRLWSKLDAIDDKLLDARIKLGD